MTPSALTTLILTRPPASGSCSIVHGTGLAIVHSARIGKGAILSQNVTIGDGTDPKTRAVGQPVIEEDVHIGPGAVVIGPVTVGARSRIGPNVVPPSSSSPAPTLSTGTSSCCKARLHSAINVGGNSTRRNDQDLWIWEGVPSRKYDPGSHLIKSALQRWRKGTPRAHGSQHQ